ncbi:hypothetical protein GCM10010964_10070 [Caldovatus sediminis]|uniref:Uncharacterized protein n=1 Tax=Caldovatus sediminis TaxID=2041189 RepID=A0A8J3EB96_9PROT|nr:hypothetical protein GCM10010964_10070 [Caldovatus sediminis]
MPSATLAEIMSNTPGATMKRRSARARRRAGSAMACLREAGRLRAGPDQSIVAPEIRMIGVQRSISDAMNSRVRSGV